jgi:membrane-associated phospholipid phosphatase
MSAEARPLPRPARLTAALAPLPFVVWGLVALARGAWRWEHVVFVVVAPALAWGTPWMRRLFSAVLPLLLLGLVYDTMRLVEYVGVDASRIHTCDIRALETRLFGVDGQAPQDWLQAHAWTPLDVYLAVPYATFLLAAIAFTLWLFVRDPGAMRRFGWTFLALNVVGFVTYHLVPTAPPWYVRLHGCAADLTAHASAGPNLERVDALLGFPYFQSFYGRSSDVFGAIPSLHVAYPLLIVLFGWPLFRMPGRVVWVVFFLSMAFAAVYLDHHWIVDVVLGVAYALVAFAIVHVVHRARGARGAGDERSAAA